MAGRKEKLRTIAPDRCETALLLVDVINPLDFPEADQILRHAPAMARRLRRLKARARKAGVPAIYVNDNFGRWRSDFRKQVELCLAPDSAGREIVRHLQPEENDYFVLKPKHSGFFASTLETLLRYLGARRLIITGLAGNFCVLFTANDAYMRDYELFVPYDCMASNTEPENRQARDLMKRYLKADVRPSTKIKLPHQPKTDS
jgi:nicotinamidase-related amidase